MVVLQLVLAPTSSAVPVLMLHHDKIVTICERFSIVNAVAIDGESFVALGGNDAVLWLKDATTKHIASKAKCCCPA